jgi:hypothetical protein
MEVDGEILEDISGFLGSRSVRGGVASLDIEEMDHTHIGRRSSNHWQILDR